MSRIVPKAARRYAEALYGLAKDRGCLATVLRDMESIGTGLDGSPELSAFLPDYTIRKPQRMGALEGLFKNGSHELSWRFLMFLESKKRMALLPCICVALAGLHDRNTGVVDVSLRSALPVEGGELELISGEIGRRISGVMRLATRTDHDLIGGFTFQVGDMVYDYSVRGALDALRKKLENG
ncbi:MAG: ATP synthase F1 subunit delta [bacterium]